MAGLSDYGENQIIESMFRNTAYSRPATWYIALFTTAPTDAGGGVEVSGNGYARQGINTGASSGWTAPTTGLTDNAGNVDFPAASGGNWGTIVAAALFDAVTGGNMWFWANLTSAKTINTGDIFRFAAGDLDVSFD